MSRSSCGSNTESCSCLGRGHPHGYAGPASRGQALPADMLSKNTETLKSMNSLTARFAKWYVKILDPKVIDYSFAAKGEKVQAQKFQCVLVPHAPEQHMLGLVPFDFKDRSAAQ